MRGHLPSTDLIQKSTAKSNKSTVTSKANGIELLQGRFFKGWEDSRSMWKTG